MNEWKFVFCDNMPAGRLKNKLANKSETLSTSEMKTKVKGDFQRGNHQTVALFFN